MYMYGYYVDMAVIYYSYYANKFAINIVLRPSLCMLIKPASECVEDVIMVNSCSNLPFYV